MSPEASTRLQSTHSLCWAHEDIGYRAAAPAVGNRVRMLERPRTPANGDVTIAVGDVCAGIGGFALGAPARWRHALFSEVDPFASAVLATRFPETPNLGDLSALDPAQLPPLHVLCGGTPCQSFSSAGSQHGLCDPRGALTLKYVELVHGIEAKPPFRGSGVPVSIWENVVRVLQADGGSQFGTILAGLVGCNESLRPAELYGPPSSTARAGRIRAWSPDLNASSPGRSSMPRTSVCPNSADVFSSLASVMETGSVPGRYSLQPELARRTLKVADQNERVLDPALRTALEAAAGSGSTSETSPGSVAAHRSRSRGL